MKWMLVLWLSVSAAYAADDPRVSFLEQEVRNLHRQVDALSRQVDVLGQRPDRVAPGSAPQPKAAAEAPTQWIDAARWRKVRPAMSELDVIGALGPPTSMREAKGTRVLLYALEMGPSAFLAGSVVLRDHVVIEVRPPVLQ
jgi:hypothetical protein